MTDFLVGANLPWLTYGCDFGANAWQPAGGLARPNAKARARDVLKRIASTGAQAVRWFLLCDGRAGLEIDGDGPRLDAAVLDDLDAALGLLDDSGLAAMFVLTDFTWFGRARMVNGVKIGGRSDLVAEAGTRGQLLDRVIAPIVDRCAGNTSVFAWDIINEPEWAVRSLSSLKPDGVARGTMRDFIRETVTLVHARTSQPATVGSARASSLGLVTGLGLDFYQVHWYPRRGVRFDLSAPATHLGLDRPVILGEFPTSVLTPTTDWILQAARTNGYAAAFGWSMCADDEASDAPSLETAIRNFRA